LRCRGVEFLLTVIVASANLFNGPAGTIRRNESVRQVLESGSSWTGKDDVDLRMKRCLVARRELRRASNEGTLRAFRNADRFATFKIFRRPGALRRRLAPG